MMYLKFAPWDEVRETALMECSEGIAYKREFFDKFEDLDEFMETAYLDRGVILSMPGYQGNPWPEDPVHVLRVDMHQAEHGWSTVFAYDCDLYVMNEAGKTIDKA